MFRIIIMSLVSSMIFSVSAMDIEAQIIKIRQADESNRYQLVNALKRELSQLGNAERMHAILALKQQMKSSSSAESITAVANCDTQLEQSSQHHVLNQYESLASISTAEAGATVEYTKGGVGAEVLDVANTGTITNTATSDTGTVVVTQVTPSRPVDAITNSDTASNRMLQVADATTVVQQESVMQQTSAAIGHIVNNAATTLPQENSIQQNNMRMLSYRI